ncbi:MAG: hypothetical protein WCT31_01905 [Candidatus Micrarchaeia archaeon]
MTETEEERIKRIKKNIELAAPGIRKIGMKQIVADIRKMRNER